MIRSRDSLNSKCFFHFTSNGRQRKHFDRKRIQVNVAVPPLGPTFDPNQVHVASVGSVVVSFIDANNAVLSYIVTASALPRPLRGSYSETEL